MKPRHKKAILYGVVLGGALIGLAADRLLSSSAPAVAATVSSAAGAGSVSTTAQAEPKGPGLARIFDLNKTSQPATSQPTHAETLRDAFALTPRMQHIYAEASPARQAEQVRQQENHEELRRQELERFQSSHKLKGTSLHEHEAWALIDDTIVRIGEYIDGFELRQIERYRVELVKNDLTVALHLPIP